MLRLAFLLFGLVGTTLAGIAVVAVVTVPAWYDEGMRLIPVAAIGAFILAAPISWLIARAIMSQTRRRQSTAY
jgi:hypothetical protein